MAKAQIWRHSSVALIFSASSIAFRVNFGLLNMANAVWDVIFPTCMSPLFPTHPMSFIIHRKGITWFPRNEPSLSMRAIHCAYHSTPGSKLIPFKAQLEYHLWTRPSLVPSNDWAFLLSAPTVPSANPQQCRDYMPLSLSPLEEGPGALQRFDNALMHQHYQWVTAEIWETVSLSPSLSFHFLRNPILGSREDLQEFLMKLEGQKS